MKYTYIIDTGDHTVEMIVDKKLNDRNAKGKAKQFLDKLYGPEIYRGGDIVSVKLKEDK